MAEECCQSSLVILFPDVMEFVMTKTEKLLKTLRTGKELSAKEIATKFGFANPYRAVAYLIEKRISVYGNKRTQRDGTVIKKYRIGTPTKRMQELGFTC